MFIQLNREALQVTHAARVGHSTNFRGCRNYRRTPPTPSKYPRNRSRPLFDYHFQ